MNDGELVNARLTAAAAVRTSYVDLLKMREVDRVLNAGRDADDGDGRSGPPIKLPAPLNRAERRREARRLRSRRRR